MKHKHYVALEVLCVLALLAFLVAMCLSHAGGTKKSVDDVAAPVLAELAEGQMAKQTNADAAKTFGLDLEQTDGVVFYANDDIMDVSELLLVKVKDEADAEAVRAAVQKHVDDQKNLYKNYAPKAYALLEDSVLETSGNMVFYATAKNAPALYDAFKAAL